MPRAPLTYRLTPALVAAHAGGPVVCLAVEAIGQSYRLLPQRPRYDAARDLVRRADVIGADGLPVDVDPAGARLLARVYISGPLESTCGYQGECGGWVDGYGGEGGIVARMKAALADSDVLVMIDSPGGAVIGLPECVEEIIKAKVQFARRVYVVVNGWAASAAYWIAACIADPGELYITRSSMAGNIGARAAHCNEAGALAIAGVEITDFAYPPGKIALSPNRAPTAAGMARGERDVMAAFEAFAAAVGAARPALTRKAIVRLDGDLLTGKAAVAAALADAVASVEDVEAWALAQSATAPGEMTMADPTKEPEGPPSKPGGRAEGGEKEPMAGCAKCGEDRPGDESRYCAKCGTKFPEKDDEEPDSSADASALAARGVGSRKGSALAATYAAMSVPALRTAAITMHRTLDAVAGKVGAASHPEILGALDAVKADAEKAQRYRAERNAERARSDARERLDLLASLYTHDPAGHPRGKLVIDVIGDNSKPTGQVKPAPQWSDGPEGRTLANLRAYARTTLASLGPAKERTPFDAPHGASEERAVEQHKQAAQGAPAAKGNPAVRKAAQAGVKEDEAAAIFAREFGGAR